MLFVSHDRYFVNRVADHLLMIEPDRIRVIEGNYDTYQQLLAGREPSLRRRRKRRRKESSRAGRIVRPSANKAAAKPVKKRRFEFRKVRDIEDEIVEREARVEEFHRELADPAVVRDGQRVRQLKAQIEQEQAALKNLYAHWDEATELNW